MDSKLPVVVRVMGIVGSLVPITGVIEAGCGCGTKGIPAGVGT